MMKMNLRYRVLLILLVSGMTCIPSFAQVREYPQQDISFTEYLNRVGKSNLVYLGREIKCQHSCGGNGCTEGASRSGSGV